MAHEANCRIDDQKMGTLMKEVTYRNFSNKTIAYKPNSLCVSLILLDGWLTRRPGFQIQIIRGPGEMLAGYEDTNVTSLGRGRC
jgi:hypothetical protein